MNSPLPPALLEQVRAAFEQISGLPLRVHVTDVEGRFLFANDAARAMFGFDPASDLSQFSIADFYEDERERQRVLKDLKKSLPHHWRKGFVVDLRIKGVWHSVRFSSLPFFDEHGELCAMLNMTDPMTWVERFADFENDLGVGLFEIDRYFKIVDCNQFLAEILGFQDPKELKDKPIGDFFWESDVPKILLEKLKANPKLRKESLKLKRTDGAVILAEMSCSAISLQDGEISRVKGVINDITFRVFQDDLPVGLFLINKNKDGKAIISQANLTFAKIHGYETVKEILGIPSDTFKSDPAEYEKYLAELAQAEKENRPLMDYYMEALDRAKQKRNVVVNVKFIPGQKGLIRVGAVYDLTNHMGKRTRTLEADFSALLHTYMATITGLLDTLGFVIKAQGQDVIKGDKHFDSDKAASEINSHRKRLESLLKEIEKMAVERDTGTPQIATLQRFWAKMIGGNTHVQGEKDNAAWQRRNLIEMRKTLDALKNVGLPRELLKNIRFEI
ncbi:MAG: PAS domain-containing protein, partial [Saprospiraceae bacterium]